MNFFSLIRIEAKKLRRSKILWILTEAAFLLLQPFWECPGSCFRPVWW